MMGEAPTVQHVVQYLLDGRNISYRRMGEARDRTLWIHFNATVQADAARDVLKRTRWFDIVSTGSPLSIAVKLIKPVYWDDLR